ncbi:MAG: hypothetical protein A2Y24_04830 [Clostridiales bacterium GWE2_32_10]|nr:MAG: hypothetical protein A2Y24_04830 [Clostridiales bacterium GWE2_32_10]
MVRVRVVKYLRGEIDMQISGNLNNMMDNTTTQISSIKTNNLKSKADAAVKDNDDTVLMDACKQFESYFIDQIMKEMRNTLSKDDGDSMIPKSKGETMFTEMKDSEYSKQATDNGGIGIAKLMFEQLKKTNS